MTKQMAFVFPTVSASTEFLYGFLIKQLGVMLTTQFQRICISSPKSSTPVAEPDDERELHLLQMDRLLKWMELVFDKSFTPVSEKGLVEAQQTYKQELFSIYRTLCSDYQQYLRWKQYNQSIWLFPSYRHRDTKSLAHKILSDIRLFKEGLQLLFLMEHKSVSSS